MNTLKLVLFQGVLSMFLSAPAHSKTMPPNLNGVMKALGSLYQDRLFSYGPGYFSNDGIFRGDTSLNGAPEVTEISIEKLCLKNYPVCMTFEGTLTIAQNDVNPFVMKKPDEVQSCYSDFKFSECKLNGMNLSSEKILDFSNVKVNDFCVPGTVKFEGSINVLKELRAKENTFLINFKNGEISNDMEKYTLDSNCFPHWDYCHKFSLDELLRMNPACRLLAEYPTLPCESPVKENIYSIASYRMNILEDIFEDTGIKSGFISSRILLFGKHRLESCIEMSFNRTIF